MTVTCIVCLEIIQESYFSKCDFCFRGMCGKCYDKIDIEINALKLKNQHVCKYCIGNANYEDFCIECKNNIQQFIASFKHLSDYSIFRKFGAKNLREVIVEQALIVRREKSEIICRCDRCRL